MSSQGQPVPPRQRAVVVTAAGGPEVLHLVEVDTPAPGPDEVLVAIEATGLNKHDCVQRRTATPANFGEIPGLEGAGRIVAVGANVPPGRIGEEVAILTARGTYAQYAVTDAALALPRPASLSWVEAAAAPEALFTVWFNVFGVMRLAEGERVLIHGGTSGVASVAMQALSALGVTVFATSGTEEKRQAAEGFGAAAAFNYNDPDLAKQVLAASGGAGVNAILDTSAGAHLTADLEMLAVGGRISHLSGGGGKVLGVPLSGIMAKRIAITGSLLRPQPVAEKRKIAETLRRDVWPLIESGRVRPPIAAVFPLDRVVDAHVKMDAGEHMGKIVLTPPSAA